MKSQLAALTGALLAASTFGLDLASFEDGKPGPHIKDASILTYVQEHATDGKYSAKAFFKGMPRDSWPGFTVAFTTEEFAKNNAITFTAWHEESGSLGFCTRTDFYEGEPIFSNFSVPPKSKNTQEIPLTYKDDEGKDRIPKSVLIYIRCPRTDSTVWFDNFKLANVKDKFKPIVFVPPSGERTPTNSEKAFGAQLFSRTWMEHIFRNVKPLPSDPADVVLKAAACPGEAEPVMLSMHALQDVKTAKVTFDAPLVSANGGKIAPTAFTVQYLAYLDKRTTYQSTSYYKEIPMVLENSASVSVKANESQSFWIDIRVPKDAKPGLYKGFVTLTLDSRSQKVPYELKVRSFMAPEATDMFFGEYLTGPRGNTLEERIAQYDSDMAYMRELNMTSVGLCVSPDIKKCTYENGKVKIDFPENDTFVLAMDLYKKYQYPAPILLLADPGDKFALLKGFKEFSPEYKACYLAFWKAMQEECKARGWAEIIVQPEDEPGWRSTEIQKRNVQLLKYLKEIPGMRTEVDGPADGYFYTQAGPYSDMWNFNGCVANPETMEKIAKEGRLVTLYNNDVESYRPVTSRYVAGFFMARSKSNGVYNWALRSYTGSAFNDFDGRLGDTTNYYPGGKARPGGPGIGLVSFREGVDDYRYINYLRKLIKEKPGKDADYAQKVLDDILASINYFTQIRNAASFQSLPLGEKGESRITGVLNLKTGWNLEDYDTAREIIATQIEKLLGVNVDNGSRQAPVVTVAAAKANAEDATNAKRTEHKVIVTPTNKPPVIDGKLDDECWKHAGIMKDFSINVGGKPLAQTRAWITSDGTNLYVAVECDEEYMSHLTANVTKINGSVFNDDCVELFFDSDMKAKGFYQLVVNSLGTYYAGGNIGIWRPEVKTGTSLGKDKWTVEIAIPMKDLKIKGSAFGFNVCRERRPLEVFELSCWSPTGETFGEPSRFGTAYLGLNYLRNVDADKAIVGNGTINVNVANPKNDNMEMMVDVSWKLSNGKNILAQQSITKPVKPGATAMELAFPIKLQQAGELDVSVAVNDANGKLLERQSIRRTVMSPVSILVSSPFVSSNWKAGLAVDYLPEAGEKLEMRVWPNSNPGKAAVIPIGKDSRYNVTLSSGTFAARDGLHVQLSEVNSKRIIGQADTVLFAK